MTSLRSADVSCSNPLLAELLEELTNKLQLGERVDLDEYVRQHPDFAEPLQRLLPALEVLIDLGQSQAVSVPPDTSGLPDQTLAIGVIGDYRILREIGRGGMGVVYEAMQVSLARRVALKVLPFAAMLDQRQLSRFQIEARAAAQLHHANIVPVHAVGCERGVHYYAMQYIDGQTLAQMIAGLRHEAGLDQDSGSADLNSSAMPRPSATESTLPELRAAATTQRFLTRDRLRALAEQVRQVAEALDYAHMEGVVHRDIKPSNLVLDARGKVWITDFGLARFDAGVTLTATGDIVGTLRYMSPEQALGHRGGVDHRTDIYALGATLYELLSLVPVFSGTDRQTLLRQIAQDEPRPLQQINRELPIELETIVHKALSKDVAARYGTAHEFADDLRRFLEHQPILARPPSVVDRVRKWCRRHEPVVWSVGGMSLLAAVGLAISTVAILAERSKALQERDHANAEQARADMNQSRAIKAVDQMSSVAAMLSGPDRSVAAQQELIDHALRFYRQHIADNLHDPKRHYDIVRSYTRAGQIEEFLGHFAQAEMEFQAALKLIREPPAEALEPPEPRSNLARALMNLANSYRPNPALRPKVEELFRESLVLIDEAVGRHPAEFIPRRFQAEIYGAFGYDLISQQKRTEGELFLRRAAAMYERIEQDFRDQPTSLTCGQATIWNSLGLLLRQTGRPSEAEAAHRRALKLLEGLPIGTDGVKAELARGHCHLGYALMRLDRLLEAEPAVVQALALREEFYAKTLNQFWLQELTLTHLQHANLLAMSGRNVDAERAFRQTLILQQKLLDQFPQSDGPRAHQTTIQLDWARFLARQMRSMEALSAFRSVLEAPSNTAETHNNVAWFLVLENCPELKTQMSSVELAKRATELGPNDARYWTTLGAALYRAENWTDAVIALRHSQKIAADESGYNVLFLAMAQCRGGDQSAAEQTLRAAVAWLAAHKRYDKALDRIAAEAAALIGISAVATPPAAPAALSSDR